MMGVITVNVNDFMFEQNEKESLYEKLLEFVNNLIESKGYKVNNIDSIIIAQAPKMAPHILKMRENIAKAINSDIDCVSIKATTEEGLGFTGNKEGISSQAICSLIKVDNK